jgi:hypothetical protein
MQGSGLDFCVYVLLPVNALRKLPQLDENQIRRGGGETVCVINQTLKVLTVGMAYFGVLKNKVLQV